MKRKGQSVISTLIATLIFLIMLVVAVIPVVSDSLNTTSIYWSYTDTSTRAGYIHGNALTAIMYILPLFLALAGLVAVAYTYFMR